MIQRRHDLEQLVHLLDRYQVVVLVGAREIGKTTISKQLKPNYYFSLEIPDQNSIINDKIDQLDGLVVLDEIQYKPSILSDIKRIINIKSNVKFLLLGSSLMAYNIRQHNSFFRRAAYFELGGLRLSDLKYEINNHILKGGLPFSYTSESKTSFQYRTSYLKLGIDLNIKESQLRLSPHLINKFLHQLATRSSTILNKSELSNLLSASRSTIDIYLNFFEQSYLIRSIPNESKNKPPKIVIRDSGLLNSILNIETKNQLEESTYFFQVWESYVIETIISEFRINNASYYSDNLGLEIDLIAEIDGKKYGYIFSYSGTYRGSKRIEKVKDLLKLSDIIVITNQNFIELIKDRIGVLSIKVVNEFNHNKPNLIAKKKEDETSKMDNPKVFISYSHKDIDFVSILKETLEEEDVEILIDIEKLKFGDNIKDFISNSIRETDYTLQVISINSLRSPYVMIEYLETQLYHDVEKTKRYIPIFIDKSIFADETYIILADDIQKEIDVVNNFISKAIVRNLHIAPYNSKRERLIDLINNLGKAIETLRESLIGDFCDKSKIEMNIQEVLNSIIIQNSD